MVQAKQDKEINTDFQGMRAIFWPIHRDEIKKFLPMGIMMFCILFNYTILRDTKDSLVVNAHGSGAEALAIIKVWGTMPAAILFMLIYSKLANVLNPRALFYSALLPFLVFFGAFAAIIYPSREVIHMSNDTISWLQIEYPRFKWFFPVIGQWSYALFYILSELWGSVVVSLLFWQFANEITRVAESKRFYGLFGLIGNFGLMLSGPTVYYFSKIRESVPEGVDPWGITLNYLMTFVVISGLIVVFIYAWMNKSVLTDSKYYDSADALKGKKKVDKPKLSLGESLKYLIRSPYLGLIAVIVLSYGVAINLVEGVWKGQIKIRFPNENDYNAFMGQFSFWTGLVTVIFMVIGNNILRRLSWFKAAMLTPIMILITGLIFFGVVMYTNSHDAFTPIMGTTMVMVAVLAGMIQNIFTKSTKYSLFDPTKEMSYIPLDQEMKVKGKAAVDVIGGRGGKFGGAFIQNILTSVFIGSTLASLAPILGAVVIVIVIIWMLAVKGLGVKFVALTQKKAAQKAE